MKELKELSQAELESELIALAEPKYRAKQIYEWIHKRQVRSIDDMLNLPKALREKLKENYSFCKLKLLLERRSGDGKTFKYLFELPDKNIIESVLMKHKHGNSVCISTQLGCRMGCRFCASTLDGLLRNLSVAEMLEQVYLISELSSGRVSHIVTMGAGEPLDNFTNVLTFIDMISNPQGLNISQRNITLSTCGLVPRIKELADMRLQLTLALSLHASDDDTRKSLMPIARKYSIAQVLEACSYYQNTTGRRVSFEYSLVADVNDSKAEAMKLAELLKGMHAHVNLIPVNPIEERDYKESGREKILAFKKILEKNAINVTIRREMGRDIDGACGQLRRHFSKSE